MNKRMREIQAQLVDLKKAVAVYMSEGENRDLDKAEKTLDEIEALQKEFDLEARAAEAAKAAAVETAAPVDQTADGFVAMAKALNGGRMTDAEKALISGDDAAAGENYLVPEDVRLAINELRKSYVSARDLCTVITTDSLTGSINYEAGTPSGLTNFDDGDDITEDTNPAFIAKTFSIKHYGALIPVSRILLGAERAGLLAYLDRWFAKNAILSENAAIFAKYKSGYASGTPKSVAGWEALKASILVDLDPSCLLDGVIVTNQSGFACLDAEKDADGRPVLQPNPANPTQKLFQGLPIRVYPDAQLVNMGSSEAPTYPMIYGSLKAGATFVDHNGLEFAASDHAGFKKNQTLLRVIEGFDVMSTDTAAYIYAAFTATPAAAD